MELQSADVRSAISLAFTDFLSFLLLPMPRALMTPFGLLMSLTSAPGVVTYSAEDYFHVEAGRSFCYAFVSRMSAYRLLSSATLKPVVEGESILSTRLRGYHVCEVRRLVCPEAN